MLSIKQLHAAAVLSCGLSRTWACRCAPGSEAICDRVSQADAILHVNAVDRVEGADYNDDVVYTLETIQVFKAEDPGPNEYDETGATFQMATEDSSVLCGVFMRTDGTEYLLDMVRSSDGELRAVTCGLTKEWSEVDRAELEAGCDNFDPCNGECAEFQTPFPTGSGEDSSRGLSFTPAPSAAPSAAPGGGTGPPFVPEASSAPTAGGADAEGDTSAATALRAATTTAFFTAAAAAAAAATAATCASSQKGSKRAT